MDSGPLQKLYNDRFLFQGSFQRIEPLPVNGCDYASF
jgi:hypothetical protein